MFFIFNLGQGTNQAGIVKITSPVFSNLFRNKPLVKK